MLALTVYSAKNGASTRAGRGVFSMLAFMQKQIPGTNPTELFISVVSHHGRGNHGARDESRAVTEPTLGHINVITIRPVLIA